jgi:hypothetical protein
MVYARSTEYRIHSNVLFLDLHWSHRLYHEKTKESILMALRALDIAVFMVVLNIVILYVPPVAAPEWADSINLGPLEGLNTIHTFSITSLASSWGAFSGSFLGGGSAWTMILDGALLGLHMLLEGLIIAAIILVAPIGILLALQSTFPQIPSVIFTLVGAVFYIIFAYAWFQILTGRGGEALT